MTSSFTKKAFLAFGFTIVTWSCVAAVFWHYNHFYGYLLLGLLLILIPFVPPAAFTMRRTVRLYILYICAALVIDLLLGLTVTKIWYYSYTSALEYAILYVWIYPAGGFVLAIPYILGWKYFGVRSADVVVD